MRLGIFSKFQKKIYRSRKVLELAETCKSGKIFFAHSRRKFGKNPLVPFFSSPTRSAAGKNEVYLSQCNFEGWGEEL